jgi:hypothetical protein
MLPPFLSATAQMMLQPRQLAHAALLQAMTMVTLLHTMTISVTSALHSMGFKQPIRLQLS